MRLCACLRTKLLCVRSSVHVCARLCACVCACMYVCACTIIVSVCSSVRACVKCGCVCVHVCVRAFVCVFSVCACQNCLLLRRPILIGNVRSHSVTAVNCCTDLSVSELFTVSDDLFTDWELEPNTVVNCCEDLLFET